VLKEGVHYCSGEPARVLDPGMIRDVYGIEALVKHDLAFPYIVPVRSLNGALE
jgi:ABC-type cobalamin/Fe3+-siderophores transport system ATPase subunit